MSLETNDVPLQQLNQTDLASNQSNVVPERANLEVTPSISSMNRRVSPITPPITPNTSPIITAPPTAIFTDSEPNYVHTEADQAEDSRKYGKLLIPYQCLLVQGCLCLNPRTGTGFGYFANTCIGGYMISQFNPSNPAPPNIVFTILECIGFLFMIFGMCGVIRNSAKIVYIATVYFWINLLSVRVAECVLHITSANNLSDLQACDTQKDKALAQVNAGMGGSYAVIQAKWEECVDLANRSFTSQKGAMIFSWVFMFALLVYLGLMMRTYTLLLFYRRNDEFGSKWLTPKPQREVYDQDRPMPVIPSPYGADYYRRMGIGSPRSEPLPAYQPSPPAYHLPS